MASRPLIGLTCYRETARWGVWNASADLLPAGYCRSVEAAGGAVVLLPLQAGGAGELIRRLDALIVTGGADIDPDRYGQAAHPRTVPRPDRDAWEFALLDAAALAGLPVLGVCRGMQAMAVWAGGSLDQHLPELVGHAEHGPDGEAFGWTSIRTEPGSLVRRLVGDAMQVSCHHHQAVATHPGFAVAARAADGTLEAIEGDGQTFRVGVQWHPESGDDHGLFAGLVAAAAQSPSPSPESQGGVAAEDRAR